MAPRDFILGKRNFTDAHPIRWLSCYAVLTSPVITAGLFGATISRSLRELFC